MKRIFLTLSILSSLLLIAAFVLGWNIGDPKTATMAAQNQVATHFLTALAALVFSALVHAIVFTYFMGTSRWMEETRHAYHLPKTWQAESQSLKYRVLLGIVFCLLLLILTGGFGAAADPASPVGFQGWGDVKPATIHFFFAASTLCLTIYIYILEFQAISRNSRLVDEVMRAVRRIREEHGLPIE